MSSSQIDDVLHLLTWPGSTREITPLFFFLFTMPTLKNVPKAASAIRITIPWGCTYSFPYFVTKSLHIQVRSLSFQIETYRSIILLVVLCQSSMVFVASRVTVIWCFVKVIVCSKADVLFVCLVLKGPPATWEYCDVTVWNAPEKISRRNKQIWRRVFAVIPPFIVENITAVRYHKLQTACIAIINRKK